MSTNIITDFQINNNLTITDNNLKIQTDGTTNTLDISGNVDVSSNLIIRGYIGIKTETPVVSIDISANDALRLPVGNNSSRPDYTAIDCSGCIRYNSETTQFEGFSPSGLSWIGLGGVVNIAQTTYITAEETTGENKLRFYTAGGQQMLINDDGNIGIGLALGNDPAYILDINSTGAIRIPIGTTSERDDITNTAGLIRYNSSNNEFEGYSTAWGGLGGVKTPTGNTKITADDTNGLEFFTSNDEKMTILANGNVGIGTTSPGAKLEVFHKFSTSSHTTLPIDSDNIGSNETVGLFLAKQPYNSTSFRYGLAMGTLSNGNSYIQSMSNDSGGRTLLLNPNSSGNVGIGTTSPGEKLEVNGKVKATSGFIGDVDGNAETASLATQVTVTAEDSESATRYLTFVDSGTGAKSIKRDTGLNYNPHNNCITAGGFYGTIYTAAQPQITSVGTLSSLNVNGNVGIGTSSPANKLSIQTGTNYDGIILNNEDGHLLFKAARSNTKSKFYIGMYDGTSAGAQKVIISNHGDSVFNAGNVGIGTSSPGAKLHVVGDTVVTGDITAYYSDERLKTFKGKITEPLAKIKQLNGYYFVENELAKSLGYDNDKLQVGVSAQEVEKVLPEIVTKAPIDHKYKTVWYQKLTPLLIEGMKEQQTQIEQQQTQIQSLQEQIDELKELIKNI